MSNSIQILPVTSLGQIKQGDLLLLNDGKATFPAKAKSVNHAGTSQEEVIISKSQNFYFILSKMLSGTSWIKSASVVKDGDLFSCSNTMKAYS